jgi:hypothetical protein
MKDVFGLQSPEDLFRKLRSDLDDLRENRTSAYAAFNFFVTAEHMVDWLYPDDGARRKEVRDSSLAGVLSSSQRSEALSGHSSASSVRGEHRPNGGLLGRELLGAVLGGYWGHGGLFVELQGDAAKELGPRISSVVLAERVLAFWKSWPELRDRSGPH